MKMNRHLIIGLIAALGLTSVNAANPARSTITESKTWTKSFEVNGDADLNLRCRESDVNISTWDENRVEVKVTLTVEAYEKEELEKMLTAFEPNISGNRTGVNVQNPDCTSEVVNNKQTKIRINNQIIKVKSYHYRFDIKMPKSNHLNAKTRFSKVKLGNHKGKISLEFYECEVQGEQIESIMGQVDMKFCDGTLGSIKELNINTYESDLTLDQSRILNMDSKFSKLKFSQVRESKITAYESELNLGITHSVHLSQNFGSCVIASAEEVELTAYEMTLEAGRINDFTITNGRFSKIIVGENKSLNVPAAYESDITVNSTSAVMIDARFCKIDIGHLQSSFQLASYESVIHVQEVSAELNYIDIEARFTTAEFKLQPNQGYRLNADLNFGSMEIPARDIDGIRIDRERQRFRAAGGAQGYDGDTRVRVKGYETTVKLLKS